MLKTEMLFKKAPGFSCSGAIVCLVIACALFRSPLLMGAEWGEKLSNLAEELVNLRSAVDRLSTDLEMKKTAMREDLRALTVQKKDLERQIKNEEVKITDLDQKIEDRKKEIQRKNKERSELKNVVSDVISVTRTYMQTSLPFKVNERIRELGRIREQLENGEMDADKVLARIWSTYEDEFRLTRESGLYKQSIELDCGNSLSEVARLGMVLMYFRTPDEQKVGLVKKTPEGWSYTVSDNKENRERILYLFDCLKKHIQEGYFVLPNPQNSARNTQ